MDVQKINYFEKVEDARHREFIETHSQCALCGTVLELHHEINHDSLEIKEEARCPECSVRTRAKIHSMQ